MAEAPRDADVPPGAQPVHRVSADDKSTFGYDQDKWAQLPPRQQRAIRIATYRAMRAFEWWYRLYSGPYWLALLVLYLRNLGVIAIPMALIWWIVTIMTNPLWRFVGDFIASTWRILTFR